MERENICVLYTANLDFCHCVTDLKTKNEQDS